MTVLTSTSKTVNCEFSDCWDWFPPLSSSQLYYLFYPLFRNSERKKQKDREEAWIKVEQMAAANSKSMPASGHASGGYSMSGTKSIIPRRKELSLKGRYLCRDGLTECINSLPLPRNYEYGSNRKCH